MMKTKETLELGPQQKNIHCICEWNKTAMGALSYLHLNAWMRTKHKGIKGRQVPREVKSI